MTLHRASALALEPLKRETVMETVARRIEGLIRTGELRVGSRLPPEPKLASMLAVSRSSLREALKGLVFLGFVKARPGHGTYIQSSLGRAVSRHFQWMVLLQEIKYLELYELRQILEPAVAALAARRASREDIEKMEEATRQMRRSFRDPEKYMEAEMAFHEGFLQAAKNTATQTMLRMMYDVLAEGRRRVLPLISDVQQNYRSHVRILECIIRRDGQGARNAVLKDLRNAEALLRQDLLSQERLRATLGKLEVAKKKTIGEPLQI